MRAQELGAAEKEELEKKLAMAMNALVRTLSLPSSTPSIYLSISLYVN
jgi:hypothetical protein